MDLYPNAEVMNYDNGLHTASLIGVKSIICRLLKRGAKVNVVGNYFGTALQVARKNKKISIIVLLVTRGAKGKRVGPHTRRELKLLGSKLYRGKIRAAR